MEILDSRVLYSNTESSELEYSPLKWVLYKFTKIGQSEYSTGEWVLYDLYSEYSTNQKESKALVYKEPQIIDWS